MKSNPRQPPTSDVLDISSIATRTKQHLLDHLQCAQLLAFKLRLEHTHYLISLSVESLNESPQR